MGRGQLKYRKRGGRGGGGASSRGRGAAGRGGGPGGKSNDTTSSSDIPIEAKRGGHGSHSTTHLPSNTEKWGLTFTGDPSGSQGNRRGARSTSVLGSQETEELLDESEWAIGASSRRLASAAPEQDRGEWAGSAASGELLSLNLDMLEKCLQKTPVHERLRLPFAYTAELQEVETQEEPALELTEPSTESRRRSVEDPRATNLEAGGEDAAGRGGFVEAATGTVGTIGSRERGDGVVDGGGSETATAGTAAFTEDEDGVLDALLGLPAVTPPPPLLPPPTGGGSRGSRAADVPVVGRRGDGIIANDVESRAAMLEGYGGSAMIGARLSAHDREGYDTLVRSTPTSEARGANEGFHVDGAAVGGDRGTDSRGGSGSGGVGVGATAAAGGGGGGVSGSAGELEDWLDGMLN